MTDEVNQVGVDRCVSPTRQLATGYQPVDDETRTDCDGLIVGRVDNGKMRYLFDGREFEGRTWIPI